MHSNQPLEGKVAIVTGGTRGIGLAIGAALGEKGASVVASARSDRHVDAAREHVARVVQGPGRFEARVADVRDHKAVDDLVAGVARDFGGIDILVNNAGVGVFGEVASQTLEQWREVIDTNLTGAFLCSRAVIPHLRRRGGGWIINISSLASKNPFAGAAAYCASKAALNAFSDVLMQEVRYDDIRVSSVLPGSVATEFGSGHLAGGADWKLAPDDVARAVVDLVLHDPRSLPSRVEIRPSKPRK
jgi:NAD(P)-dependent dehydrogenase (short-subunit alcohol dehydrogenase family)